MTIQEMKERGLLIFEGIVGSQAYGLATPTSDTDMKGVFIQPLDDILSFGYIEQVNDKKNDLVYYEIRRFLELIATGNPNILELLNLPDDMITFKDPIYDLVLEHADKFISKQCKNSFGGYAIAQIGKARGLNKKIVNPIAKEKKTPLDFCNVIQGNGTVSLTKYLKEGDYLEQKFCGIVNVPNARDIYALYNDLNSYHAFSENSTLNKSDKLKFKEHCVEENRFLHYKGIIKETEDGNFPSNQLRLSSIPKGEKEECIFSFNQDGYTKYCKDYNDYWKWVENRNEARYNDNAKHGKGYDSKNMMHCHRLLDMAIEIGSGEGINVRRENRDYLLNIRSGEMNYDELVEAAERKIKLVDEIFDNSDLPKKVDSEFVNDLLIKMRYKKYGLV